MKLLGGKRCRTVVLFTLVAFTAGIVYFGYFCPDQVCALSSGSPTPPYKTPLEAYLKGELPHQDFAERELDRDYDFNIEGDDVIVYLHVQKTGGTTFGRHLVKNIQLTKPCKCYRGRKRCDCMNSQKNIWLFSRHSTGWACGLHADWTELKDCVNDVLDSRENNPRKRRYRYLYITIMRDPLMRYLSEWKHVQRGSTWLSAKLRCNGRSATLQEVPFCFAGEDWSGVSLDEFIHCPHNLAANRLTRMLSNLSLVGCYNFTAMNQSARDAIMLQSAKDNLRDMAFFGLTEYQRATQYMFERTFKLHFIDDFVQRNVTHASEAELTKKQRDDILHANRLDIELYQYAKDLFFQRLHFMQEEDARNNITSHLLMDNNNINNNDIQRPILNGKTNSDIQGYPGGVESLRGPGSKKRRRKARRRHKYRTNGEIEAAMLERDDYPAMTRDNDYNGDYHQHFAEHNSVLLPLNQQQEPPGYKSDDRLLPPHSENQPNAGFPVQPPQEGHSTGLGNGSHRPQDNGHRPSPDNGYRPPDNGDIPPNNGYRPPDNGYRPPGDNDNNNQNGALTNSHDHRPLPNLDNAHHQVGIQRQSDNSHTNNLLPPARQTHVKDHRVTDNVDYVP